jgi:SAM-dependent methyltransferase
MSAPPDKISGETVRGHFNEIESVLYYTRAAHGMGLWESERRLIERHFPDRAAPLLEAGCGAGRVTLGLWEAGYREITAFDFAEELVEQARSLAAERGANAIRWLTADATRLSECHLLDDTRFAGALFLFNGLMQIPGRESRRAAMRGLHALCRPGARFIFTSHDRDDPGERHLWVEEAERWARGTQDPRLLEYGDRYFAHEHGHTFMHLPDRGEILDDLAATSWSHVEDATRDELARENKMVREFSDNCRFWVARKA